MTAPVSKCCQSKMLPHYDGGGTAYHVCQMCKEPCDPAGFEDRPPDVTKLLERYKYWNDCQKYGYVGDGRKMPLLSPMEPKDHNAILAHIRHQQERIAELERECGKWQAQAETAKEQATGFSEKVATLEGENEKMREALENIGRDKSCVSNALDLCGCANDVEGLKKIANWCLESLSPHHEQQA